MASAAQVQANRSNAQKSTGPRTPQGKTVVAQNAVTHGLLAKEVIVKGEDPGEFEFYRDQMLAELAPAGQMESMLAQRIVGLSWRLRRAERLQAAAFDKVEDQNKPPELVLSPEQASRLLAVLAETGVQAPEPVAAGPAGRAGLRPGADSRSVARLRAADRAQPVPDDGGVSQAAAAAGDGPAGGRRINQSLKFEVGSFKWRPCTSNFTLPTSNFRRAAGRRYYERGGRPGAILRNKPNFRRRFKSDVRSGR